jgi:hypothetical protein
MTFEFETPIEPPIRELLPDEIPLGDEREKLLLLLREDELDELPMRASAAVIEPIVRAAIATATRIFFISLMSLLVDSKRSACPQTCSECLQSNDMPPAEEVGRILVINSILRKNIFNFFDLIRIYTRATLAYPRASCAHTIKSEYDVAKTCSTGHSLPG